MAKYLVEIDEGLSSSAIRDALYEVLDPYNLRVVLVEVQS